MDTTTGVTIQAAPGDGSEPSPEQLLADLERVASRVKSGWGSWDRNSTSGVSDDLLPNAGKKK